MLHTDTFHESYTGVVSIEEIGGGSFLDEGPQWRPDPTGKRGVSKTFAFVQLMDALWFVNNVAILADEEHRKPVLRLEDRTVTVLLPTPEAEGPPKNDIVLSTKIDRLYSLHMEPRFG